MDKEPAPLASGKPWTLRKAVTTLAIAPQTESLTRAGRLAYNVMIFKAQRMEADGEGGYSAPMSEIVKGYEATTRDSSRVRSYIEQMCTTLVTWFPLSASDEAQASIAGLEPTSDDPRENSRIFTLLAEARFSRRAGELWVTWFYPPTIRDMVIEPSRWAQLDIKEMAALSTYASIALYEICARYKDAPGGLTNRAPPEFWTKTLRHDPDTKPREWRKFKNETLKPAIAEICQRTSLDVRLVEYKQGRAVTDVQFAVKRKQVQPEASPVDLSLVENAADFGIRERELDQLVHAYGEKAVQEGIELLRGRTRAQPSVPINNPLNYLRKLLRTGAGRLLEEPAEAADRELAPAHSAKPVHGPVGEADAYLQRVRQLNEELDALTPAEFEVYAEQARKDLVGTALDTPATMKRFANRQYRSPVILEFVRNAYATARYGRDWKVATLPLQVVQG
ncbi:replication initiation protein [Caenimonas sedimenti]|uniref:Replication initiation protein n=1 Tax=Caenimonas sedimenti TaxID=2596921 RepID=A0A562ZT01_9BURK|nr:replication initiation protein [Caenimonas sedimenti]TWO71501.1 replication initiation protein [Caenimonas sedimenti]